MTKHLQTSELSSESVVNAQLNNIIPKQDYYSTITKAKARFVLLLLVPKVY